MSTVVIFLLSAGLLALLGLVAVLNFYRYKFKGDQTLAITLLLVAAFLASLVGTLFLFLPAGGAAPAPF